MSRIIAVSLGISLFASVKKITNKTEHEYIVIAINLKSKEYNIL